MKYSFLFVIIISALLCSQCDGIFPKPKPLPEPTLPAETQEGKHTFGCLVNGKVWVPRGSKSASHVNSMNADYDGNYFYVTASLFSDQVDQSIAIHITQGMNKPGVYLLNNRKESYLYFDDANTDCYYGLDSLPQSGIIEITKIDTKKFFISGRFSFTLVQPGCDTIRVTDGRFDVKYGY
jgi:hypothetical protein